nr:mitochondrial import inner membrane translocase subunit tim10 [Quercus suber]
MLPLLPAKLYFPFFTDSSRTRLVDTCTRKCIPNNYREADLNKGESVCLDRCVSKFFEVNVKVSEKMQVEKGAFALDVRCATGMEGVYEGGSAVLY